MHAPASHLSEQTTVVLLLCAVLDGSSPVKQLSARELSRLIQATRDAQCDFEELARSPATTLIASLAEAAGLKADRIQALLGRGVQLSFRLQEWLDVDLWILSRLDPAYPPLLRARLGEQAPPLLFGRGPLSLLVEECAVGVAGSREADDLALTAARAIGEEAAAREWVLISGSARGVDREAMGAALEVGGGVIGIEHSALKKTVMDRGLRDHLRHGLLLMSPYAPEAPFSVGNAMGRNKLVYAMSTCSVVVASGISGGTWEGARENLKAGWCPVFIPAGVDSPGRPGLLAAGAMLFDGPWPPVAMLEERAPITPSEPHTIAPAEPPTLAGLFWQLLEPALAEPRSIAWIVSELQLEKAQVLAWLKPLLEDGRVLKLSGSPTHYFSAKGAHERMLGLFAEEHSAPALAKSTQLPSAWIKCWIADALQTQSITKVPGKGPARWIRADRALQLPLARK